MHPSRVFAKRLPDTSDTRQQTIHGVRGRIGPNFELIRDIIVVFLTRKNEEDPIKNEGARVVTRLYIDFSHTQGQLTPQSVVESRRNSSSSKLL